MRLGRKRDFKPLKINKMTKVIKLSRTIDIRQKTMASQEFGVSLQLGMPERKAVALLKRQTKSSFKGELVFKA